MAYKRPRDTSPAPSQKRARGAAQNIKLGTELPPDDDGDFVPVWKQTVTDDRGRRRLHGAFTGGFSAGYFNTVGSKEGWTPKTFVSSRSNRQKDQSNGAAQRPEDYMDEEDLAAAAESRQLETAQDFAAVGSSSNVGAVKDAFFGLFISEKDTMGVKILQKMGWRREQGLGRKVRRPVSVDDDVDMESSQHLFAPEDVRSMPTIRQEQRHGLGFQSEARLSKTMDEEDEDATNHPFQARTLNPRPLKKAAPRKPAFGVGVLNDTGSDDEDPYELGPKISFNRTIGKDKKAKKPSKFAKAGDVDKVVFVPTRVASKTALVPFKTSHNGHTELPGFGAVDATIQPSKPKFPPPKVPQDFDPTKGSAPGSGPEVFQSVADAAKSSTLDAKARASLLGEASLPGKSVFDFISQENRDRIAALTGKASLPQGLGQAAPEGHKQEGQKSLWSFVPTLDKDVAASVLAKGATGWMPYADDPKKRARYVAFLELRAELRNELPERAEAMSVSDWAKELQEFSTAAQVFKPVSGIMASRFMSSTSSSQSVADKGAEGKDLLRAATSKPEDPAEQAAKMGMYGPMTRSQFSFMPTRLLCKRFNVPPPPMPDAPEPGFDDHGYKTQEPVNKPYMDKMMDELLTCTQRPAWMNSASKPTAPATEHATVDVEKNEALSNDRAPEDVFKSIFGDDDDDE